MGSDFDFEQFLTLFIEYPVPLTELSRQRGRCWILIFPFLYIMGPSFMPPIHFWRRTQEKSNHILACSGPPGLTHGEILGGSKFRVR